MFNAIGGSITGVAILIMIIMVIWYLKRVEKEKKASKEGQGEAGAEPAEPAEPTEAPQEEDAEAAAETKEEPRFGASAEEESVRRSSGARSTLSFVVARSIALSSRRRRP